MSTTTRNEIIASIDSMNDVIQESEMGVLCSLLDQADKASVILESYDGNELDMFAIYQEADEAVQSGDPSGQANAEAKKKNIFVKIWEFIKNLIGSIGNFIKKCWNGTVVPTAETVSEKTTNILDKILGKDESWIKEHAKEIGLTAGGIAAAIAIVGIIKRNEIKEAVDNLTSKLKLFFDNFRGIIRLDFTGFGITTNINSRSIIDIIKRSGAIFTAAKTLTSKKIDVGSKEAIDKLLSTLRQLKDLGPGIVSDATTDLTFQEVSTICETIKNTFIETGIGDEIDKNTTNIQSDNTDIDEEKGKLLSSMLAKLGSAWTAISSFFKKYIVDKIAALINKSKDLEPGGSTENTGDQGDAVSTNEQKAETESKDVGSTESTGDSVEKADEEAEAEEEEETPNGVRLSDEDEDKVFTVTKHKGISDVKTLKEKYGNRSLTLDKNNLRERLTKAGVKIPDGKNKITIKNGHMFFVESYTDDDYDDEVVSESHTGYYYFK